jgi:peroxiredoxin family protein
LTKYYYHSWTKNEEEMLKEIMLSSDRKKSLELLVEASEKLQRTVAACENRWYDIREKKQKVQH